MSEDLEPQPRWRVPQDVADYCRSVRNGTFRSATLLPLASPACTLAAQMPPVAEQSVSSTCLAHAVAQLVAYAEDPERPPRLSAQFLFDRVKRAEREWVDRNLGLIRIGLDPDAEFLSVYRRPYEQLKTVLAANGGAGGPLAGRFVAQFEEQLRRRTGIAEGSFLHRFFEVVREQGICSETTCPTASVQRESLAHALGEGGLSRASRDEALRHRVRQGLVLLEHPNGVNAIRKVLAGAENRRPMPVCSVIDIFEGCRENGFAFPVVSDAGETENRPLGAHAVLIVGYSDCASEPGGGHFIIRNSWGRGWGRDGYGDLPYAYLEIFGREAGTILVQRDSRQGVIRPAETSGGVCSVCGREFLSGTSLRYRCEAPGCEERICFDCHARKNARRCQKHARAQPREM